MSTTILDLCREQVSDAHATILMPRFTRALARYPFAPPLIYSIGMVCLQFGYIGLWQYYTNLALELPHVTKEDLVFRAEAKIRLGDWSGWVDREARLFNPDESTVWQRYARDIQWTTRAWDGDEAIDDLTLLVIADGGFGDCFQMLRYIPTLTRFSHRIVLLVRAQCRDFVRHVVGGFATVIDTDDLPSLAFDRYVWLMSMPALIGPPPSFDIVTPPGSACRHTSSDDRLRIGVCWAGDSIHPTDPSDLTGSLSLDDLAPLLNRAELACYSLQVGPWACDAERYHHLGRPDVPLATFTETANMIGELDCVVTVDTSVAHVSGILGIPTFLMLSCGADFRWGLGPTTLWYPSVHLIRQRTIGDWPRVVADVWSHLEERDLTTR
jgi:hypothetical protein